MIPRAGPSQRLFRLAAAGLTLVIALVVAAGAGYVSATRWVAHTLDVGQSADDWLLAALDAETGARGYLLSGKPAFLLPYASALRRERSLAAHVRRLVEDNPTQGRNVDDADRDAQAAIERFQELVALAQAGHRDEAVARASSADSKLRTDAFRDDVRRIHALEERLLRERSDRARLRGVVAGSAALVLSLASCALLGFASSLRRSRQEMLERANDEGARRLQALSDVAAALSEARARSAVADVVVEHGMRAAGADACTLYMLDESGRTLELIGERGVAFEITEKIRRISATDGNPRAFATLESGNTLWAENEAEYAALYPGMAALEATGPRAKAFWSVPLVVEGRPVGLLGMGFYRPRKFAAGERMFVETLAKQCAQALLRASRLEGEDEARSWFTTTLRSIGDGVIATDPEGRVTFMNAVAEELTGWVEGDARGRDLADVFAIFSEQTGQPAESPVSKVLREGTVVGLANHTVLRKKSGRELPIDDSGAPIRGESGRMAGVVLVFRDATHEKIERFRREFLAQAGEALVSSLDYQTTLATVARLAVPTLADWCAVDLIEPGAPASYQAVVAHVDPAKVQLARELGERYPPNPNARTGAPEVIRSGKAELYAEIPTALLEGAARDAEHLRMIRELRLESAMVVPLRGRTRTLGAITFVYAGSARRYGADDLAFAQVFADHAAMAIENAIALMETDQARAEEQRLRGETELASRAKDEFLAMVSHELRTPLNAILGWTLTLRRRAPPADVDRGLTVIERNARAQAKLIEDVLDISRIISGKLALSLGPTNVADAVAAAVETVTPAAEAKGIAISVVAADGALTITADADRVQQIIWNLLSNAVKFTPKGGGVRVEVAREGSDVRVAVRDTGEGIRPQALPLVFEPFHQADASTTRRHGGLGLGLAIVKQLVTAHGGSVRAESDGEGQGATFVVNLPARSAVAPINRSARPPTSPEIDTAAPAAPAAPAERPPRLDGLRLLVVDDEEDALALVGEVLSEYGAEVYLARSASDALAKLQAMRPHVIVSDIGMPEMDGYALIRRIRALPLDQGGRTPAIALTAYARAEDAERAFSAGFEMHVAKPVEPAKLAKVVASLQPASPGGA